ncbi:OmpH family outer membrane protein [Maribellus comscasis]|uniref:OmpH family outer membrane protein n=1 Tax=Maribellus comscasis TaxID=2681766 RepID=A0A6I6JZ62_9BACT|nr:OmpH family outer membrane protein [Maribellus comscasis]QGY45497.1 OmpH family outer membrane protein [Maribellus comscasis]
MRNLLKLFAVILLMGTTASINAQTLKFGHIDLQALVQVMPERTTAQTEMNDFQADIEEIFGGMQTELQQKYTEFEQLGEEASEVKRNAKITEIQDLQQRIENYRATAQQQIQQKNAEVFQPIVEKAQKAVEEVAKEQGLIYVFDINAVIYKSNQSIDVLPLVKKKLGIE